MRLDHPVENGEYSEIREAVEDLLDPSQGFVGLAALDDAGIFDMFDEMPLVAPAAVFEGQGGALGTGATVEAFIIHGLRSEGFHVPDDLGMLVASGDRFLGLTPPKQPDSWLVLQPGAPGVRLLGGSDVAEVSSIDPSVTVVSAPASMAETGRLIGETHNAEARFLTATALQLTGIGEHILTSARDYSKMRHQFNRPISAFQAVQMLLADAAVAIAAARSLARAALQELSAEASSERVRLAALIAAGSAARALTQTTRSGLQVFGAVGYTIEHEFPRYYRRGQLLAYLISARTLDARITQAALESGVPELLPVETWRNRGEEEESS